MRKASLTIIAGFAATLLAGVSLGTPADAAKPSYDCAKAKSSDEIAVCGNERLAGLDVILAFGFTYLRTHIGKEASQKLAKTFLKERQACGDSMECIRGAYIAANLEYQKNGAPILVPEWGFRPIGRNPVTAQGSMDQVLPNGTTATGTPAVIAPTPTETSVSPAGTTETRVVSTQPSSNTTEPGRIRRLCHYTMGQMQRFDGKPHSLTECLPDPDAYREKISDDNRRVISERKATGKSIDNLPDGRPLESQMISWQGEIEDFRLDQSFASVDAVMTTVDIFDTWGTTLKNFSTAVSTDIEKQHLASLRIATEARLRQLFPSLRQALGQELKKNLWLDNVAVEISGPNAEIITLTGYIFGANRNIAATSEALAPMLKKMHFAEIRFKLNNETDKYKFYKLSTPDDGAIVVWQDNQNYEAVFLWRLRHACVRR